MTALPVAIVGAGCVLPGARSPGALWDLALSGRSALTAAPPGRWRADGRRLGLGGLIPAVGGFVSGPEDPPDGYLLAEAEVAAADPVLRWLLSAARQALSPIGLRPGDRALARAGAVVGNLSYPTRGLARFAEAVWLGEPGGRAEDRFSSGLPAHRLGAAFGMQAGCFALDAACASSLYAIACAIARLADGTADLMLAGGVNAIDPLVLHTGFFALGAISPSGRSRPFHAEADGLVPAEGAALVALKQLDRALADGDPVLAVIEGVGLSNDGREGGVLAPAASGQRRAIERALAEAGVTPKEIGLVECHATGTARGDAVEVEALAAVHAGRTGIPAGSIKGNIGHPVTAAGAAGLIKAMEALRRGILPPAPPGRPLLAALEGSPFVLEKAPRPWPAGLPRRASVSAFGFGGANAHLILAPPPEGPPASVPGWRPEPAPVAVVGIALRAGGAADLVGLAARVLQGGGTTRLDAVDLPLAGLRVPPSDLQRALPLHALLLQLAREAVSALSVVPTRRTWVVFGAQCDAEAARHAFRLRLPDLLPGADADAAGVPAMEAPEVIGCMPNMPANRVNAQLDLGGAGFTVAAEELSGLRAVEVAVAALRDGVADLVLAGAGDLSDEPVQRAALAALRPDAPPPGDAGVVLALCRLDDALVRGERVLAVLDAPDPEARVWPSAAAAQACGHAHAASGLLELAACIATGRHGAWPGETPWLPVRAGRRARLEVDGLGGATTALGVTVPGPAHPQVRERLHVVRFQGADLPALLARVQSGTPDPTDAPRGPGPALALAGIAAEIAALRDDALARLQALIAGRSPPPWPEGAAFRAAPLAGETAFVFTGAAAAYPGMGRGLALAMPGLVDAVNARCRGLRTLAGWVYEADAAPGDFGLLCGASLLCQVHAEASRRLLGLRSDAALGLSSGETNALFALGIWSDMAEMLADVERAGIYDRLLDGRYEAVRAHWAAEGIAAGGGWENWQALAPAEAVRDALAGLPGVAITIVAGPSDCLVGGPAAGCAEAARRLGGNRMFRAGFGIACHAAAAGPAAEIWRRIHTRATFAAPGVRLYANAWNAPYVPTRETVAEALTVQALQPIDFPTTVWRAWQDGVRIFVEHGPRDRCTQAIGQVLDGKPHLAVALDQVGRDGFRQVLHAAAELAAAGAKLDLAGLNARLADLAPAPAGRPAGGPVLRLPAHLPPIDPARLRPAELMEPAPVLAPARPVRGPRRAVAAAPGRAGALAASWHAGVTEAHLQHLRHAEDLFAAFLRATAALAPRADQTVVSPALPRKGAPLASPPSFSPPSAPGPLIGRAGLEALATGPLSAVLGPDFAPLDRFRRLVRMPAPPLLLADRVTALEGDRLAMGAGTIRTETDVVEDAWYLHNGRMPAGYVIEAGQADLLLISWLGADLHNRGERVYRLLGCELTFHGPLPEAGETLRYQIRVDGHARQGEIGLFFFSYDCTANARKLLTVRGGQAGFFSDAELAGSEGVLWSAETAERTPDGAARLAPPPRLSARRAFPREQVAAFAAGRADLCFGPGFEEAASHTRTPSVPAGRELLVQAVEAFEPDGGPWRRGYLRARRRIDPADWFFEGHFKDDPCMPGTVMFEGCLQTMAFYLAASGHTLVRDGWRFEPVAEEIYRLRCRGQVTPESRDLVFELFVDEITDDPVPTLYADLLCTIDGRKAFHCRRMGYRLVPDWPMVVPPADTPEGTARAAAAGGVRFDRPTILASTLGPPSRAFGPGFARFDGGMRLPRLPAPPYLLISRITSITGEPGVLVDGMAATAECDAPAEAWFLADGPMPFGVLMEAALQPCGWLVSFAGVPLRAEGELRFRNLDGTATVHGEVRAGGGPLQTRTTLVGHSQVGPIVIVTFDVVCRQEGRTVMEMHTVFGFFPEAALAAQVGLPATEAEHATQALPATKAPEVERGRLRMLDRITGLWPDGGRAGLGMARAEMDVDPAAWFFKAHFYQDPVQPGSLGIAAMMEVLRHAMTGLGLDAGMRNPVFDPVRPNVKLTWRYRGQVTPSALMVVVTAELLERERAANAATIRALCTLWVDGRKIYEAELALSVRDAPGPGITWRQRRIAGPWLNDHCPTYTIPALPLAGAATLLAEAAADAGGASFESLRMHGWAVAPPEGLTTRVLSSADGAEWRLQAWRQGADPERSRFETIATGRRAPAVDAPTPPDSDGPATVVHDPAGGGPDLYAAGRLFHGPAYRVLQRLARAERASFARLRRPAGVDDVLALCLLLDGVTQAVPNDDMAAWVGEAGTGQIGYPLAFECVAVAPGAASWREADAVVWLLPGPAGAIRISFRITAGEELAAGVLAYGLLPAGPLGSLEPAARAAFLRDRRAVSGAGIFRAGRDATGQAWTRARMDDLAANNWCPGTIATAYGLTGDAFRAPDAAMLAELAVREHAARALGVHPATIVWVLEEGVARIAADPGRAIAVSVAQALGECTVRG